MLLAFMPIFTLFLGLVQLGVLYVADLAVHHAAYRAARAAAVVLDDDPRYYEGEARGEIGGRPVSSEELLQRLSRMGASAGEVPSAVRLVRALSRRAGSRCSRTGRAGSSRRTSASCWCAPTRSAR